MDDAVVDGVEDSVGFQLLLLHIFVLPVVDLRTLLHIPELV